MTAVVDHETSQDIELAAASIGDFEDVEVSSMSEDSDDERSRSKATKMVSARASSSTMPRRSFYSVQFESIPPIPKSFPPQPPSPKPSQSSAEQAPRQDQAADLGRPENPRSRPSDSSLLRAFSHDWIFELTFLLIAVLFLMAIFLILLLYNGHLFLDLPRVITVNAILAIFSTSMTAALSVPLTLSISQAKWDWFHNDQGEGNPLSDLEVYDQASRGPWGALVMLGKIRWRHFSSLGAAIIVLTLAADCTIQQTISYQLRLAASPSRALSQPTLPISLGYNDTGSNDLWYLMGKAIEYGLLGVPPTSVSAAVSCPSGECTWQAYDTLAVQSSCENVTSKYQQRPAEASYTEEHVEYSVDMSPIYPGPPKTQFFNASIYYFKSIGSEKGRNGSREPEAIAFQTYECSLFWDVHSFSSATATGGILKENREHHNIEEGRVRIVSNRINSSTQPPAGEYLSSSASSQTNFTVDESSSYNLFLIVGALLKSELLLQNISPVVNGNGNSSSPTDPCPFFRNIAKAISAQLRTVPFSSAFSSSSSSSSYSSSYSSISLPNATKTTFVALGTAFDQEPVLIVRWAWLAFPVFLLFSTTTFLFLVIFTARNPVWKDSIWPLLVLLARPRHQGAMGIGGGEGQGQGQGQGWGNGVGDMKRMMAELRVKLRRGGTGVWGFTFGRQEAG